MKHSYRTLHLLCCAALYANTYTADLTPHYTIVPYDHALHQDDTLKLVTPCNEKEQLEKYPEALRTNTSIDDFKVVQGSFHRFVLCENNQKVVGLAELFVNDEDFGFLQKNNGHIESIIFDSTVELQYQKLLTSKTLATLKALGAPGALWATHSFKPQAWPEIEFETKPMENGSTGIFMVTIPFYSVRPYSHDYDCDTALALIRKHTRGLPPSKAHTELTRHAEALRNNTPISSLPYVENRFRRLILRDLLEKKVIGLAEFFVNKEKSDSLQPHDGYIETMLFEDTTDSKICTRLAQQTVCELQALGAQRAVIHFLNKGLVHNTGYWTMINQGFKKQPQTEYEEENHIVMLAKNLSTNNS